MRERRRHGCQYPFSHESVSAVVYQTVAIAWYAVVAFGFLSGSPTPVTITAVLWSVFLAVGLACWLWCQLADPSVVDTNCVVIRNHDGRYCAVCRKSVPGLDHHCKWLNTCIGTRTYFAFYLLTFTSAALYAWQTISLALLMSVWRSDAVKQKAFDVFGETDIGFYVVSAVGIALSLPPMTFHTLLAGFHTYLIKRNLTTYEFLIERSKKQREKSRLKKTSKMSSKEQNATPATAGTKSANATAKATSVPQEPAEQPSTINQQAESQSLQTSEPAENIVESTNQGADNEGQRISVV